MPIKEIRSELDEAAPTPRGDRRFATAELGDRHRTTLVTGMLLTHIFRSCIRTDYLHLDWVQKTFVCPSARFHLGE